MSIPTQEIKMEQKTHVPVVVEAIDKKSDPLLDNELPHGDNAVADYFATMILAQKIKELLIDNY